jgi:hypothetical protein
VLIPSNQAALGDLQPNSLSRAASGGFDTDSGCQAGSSLGDCVLVEPAGSVKVCVCRVGTLTISNLRVTGEAALAVLAWSSISVDGTLDLSASGDASGAGAVASSKGDATGMLGGAGGSNGTVGGNLGDTASPASVIPLRGGQAGQFGCNDRVGGGAGGGVQLSAGDSVTVGGTIMANGGGGQGGNGESLGSCLGGAGGGSGGSILIEAPTVTITGSIYANGGAGGGGGSSAGETGGGGADASCSLTPAVGGQGRDGHGCALYGNTEGGDGGAGAVGSSNGGDGQAYDELQCPETFDKVGGGGGGGAVGRLRVNTRTTCSCTGTFSPPVSSGHAQGT